VTLLGLAVAAAYADLCVAPEPVIGFVFPARRYGAARPEPMAPERGHQAPRDEGVMRTRAVRDHRLVMVQSIADNQEQLLYSKADELERTHMAELMSASGKINARIIRFRWGADVLEITRSRGGEHDGWSCVRLARSPRPARFAVLTREFAKALAAHEPPPVPRSASDG
jgi:hypothetical protein